MTLSAFQYMVLASTSYYNHKYQTDGNSNNDNDDRSEVYLAEINQNQASETYGVATKLLGLPGWTEFIFNQNMYDSALPVETTSFNYETHVQGILKAKPENAGFDFKRSGLDAKIFTDEANVPIGNPVEVVIAFAGTDKGYNDGLKDVFVDVDLSDGDVTDQAYAAIYYTIQAKEALDIKYGENNYTVSFTGHSLGGHLASVTAAYFGDQPPFTGEAHIFNSAPQTDQILDIITGDGMSGNAVGDLIVDGNNEFPALALKNTDSNAFTIKDYHLTNDALRTASTVDDATATSIANFLDNVPEGVLLLGLGVGAFTGGVGALGFGVLTGLVESYKLRALNFDAFNSGDYFTSGTPDTIDLGADVPFDYLVDNLNAITDITSFFLGQPTLSVKILNAIVNLHLGGQLFFMLDDKVQANDFKGITADEKLPWFWTEAFNADVVGFETAGFQHPDSKNPHSFFQELIRTRYDDSGDLGLVDNFLSQMDLVAGANFDNLLTIDGTISEDINNNAVRDSYNIFETVVQHAIMQHTRNQIEDNSPAVTNIIDSAADGLLTIDLSFLDQNAAGTEAYQVESLLSHTLALRDLKSYTDPNNFTLEDKLLFGFRFLTDETTLPNVPIIHFVESGNTQKLYLDGSSNTGVSLIMDQMATEQTITVTGSGGDTIQGNMGGNLVFAGAGDDTITSGSGNYDDLIYGGWGNDTIFGSDGSDFIHGSEDWPEGTTDNGSDTIDYSLLTHRVAVGPTTEFGELEIVAQKGNTVLEGIDKLRSIENYVLTDYDDVFFAYDGLITPTAIIAGGNNSTSGHDVLNLSLLSSGVTINIDATSGSTGFSGFEEVIGTNFDDFITADINDDWLFGGNGIDHLHGNAGEDHIIGGQGSDFLYGGTESDTYYFSLTSELPLWQQGGSDFISDSGGLNDVISLHGGYQFNPTDFTVLGGALLVGGVGTVDVANQIERVRYSDSVDYSVSRLILDEGAATGGTETGSVLEGDAMSNSLTPTFSSGEVYGYGGDDWLYSDSAQVILFGGDGEDYLFGAGVLDGGEGNDYLDGQANDNVIYIASGGVDVISDLGAGGDLIATALDENDNEVDLSFTLWKADNDSLVIDFSNGLTSQDVINSTHKVVVLNHFNPQNTESLEFINGNTIDTFGINVLSSDASDYLVGTAGADIIAGGSGNDIIETLDGSDTVFDGINDSFYTLSAGDHIHLSGGSDQIELGIGAASAGDPLKTFVVHLPDGISSNDLVLTQNIDDLGTINIAYGVDDVDLLSASLPPLLELFSGGGVNIEDLTLNTFGTSSDDTITDFVYLDESLTPANITQDDIIFAGEGEDDVVVSNGGNDIVYGGAGDDTIGQIELPGFPTTGSVTFYGESGNDALSTLTIAGSLYGGEGNDILVSNDTTDTLDGGVGDDWISAGNGTDDVQGGEGNDTILGLLGGAKTVDGGAGNDLIIVDSVGDDTISGGDGEDTLSFEGSFGFVTAQIDLSSQTANIDGVSYSYSGIENILGTYGNDTITGDDQNNILDGGTGLNVGFTGNDTLLGGAGSDTYVFGTPFEARVPPNQTPGTPLDPIVGHDIVNDASGSSDSIEFTDYFTLSDLSFNQVGSNLVISFTDGSVTIIDHFGSGEIEHLILGDGTTLALNDHLNWIVGTENTETLNGTAANQTVLGLDADDVINAHDGGNTLYGGAGVDTLNGGLGNDILSGGAGNDIISGGAGNDIYSFSAGDGIDIISDSSGFDILDVQGDIRFFDLTFTQVGDDLQIDIASGVTITDFYAGNSDLMIEEIHFEDGSVYDLTLLLNNNPSAVDDSFSGNQNITVLGNVLIDNGNGVDSDVDNDSLSVVADTITTSNGSVTITSNGDFTYTPNAGFIGTDSFIYTLKDGRGGTDTATATIDIAASAVESPEAINIASTGFNSYSGNQDAGGVASLIYSATGAALDGNAWKKIVVPMEYTVTSDTYITFEYKSTIEGEIQGFGLDDDDNYNTGPQPFQLYGTDSPSSFINT